MNYIRKQLKKFIRKEYLKIKRTSIAPATTLSSKYKDVLLKAGIPLDDHFIFCLNCVD